MQNYSSLIETRDPEPETTILVHVAESSRGRWTHIRELDPFFTRLYQYHQRQGFFCMLVEEILQLCQYIFIFFLTAYLFHGIDYKALFRNDKSQRLTFSDFMLPLDKCIANFGLLTWTFFAVASFVWMFALIRFTIDMFHFWDIKQFYNTALKIDDNDLSNLTWHEVQTRVMEVQKEQLMVIHKQQLSELDIYHRILRHTNYLVALVNKGLMPPRLKVPGVGEMVYWTSTLRFNMQILLFWSQLSFFQNTYELREEYKRSGLRLELAERLRKNIFLVAVANACLAPLLFVWQLLHFFFSYGAVIRREPGLLTLRRWSLYGRLYLRHFNELDHELQARLARAYRPANKYLASFTSRMTTIVLASVRFFAASILGVLSILALIDGDIFEVEYMITTMAILVGIFHIAKTATADGTPSDVEDLLTKVMQHAHYLPSNWVGQAHTTRVRKGVEQLLQYTLVGLIESVLSPILVPYVLYFHIRPRSLDIVDFFRNFTVNVVGVGDVCSFAQMDVRRHGNPEWQSGNMQQVPNQYSQGEDGKVELSLMHFTTTNPNWKPPESVQEFVNNVHNQSSQIGSVTNEDFLLNRNIGDSVMVSDPTNHIWRAGEPSTSTRSEIPLDTNEIWRNNSLRLSSHHHRAEHPIHTNMAYSVEGPTLESIRDMSLTATYLHSVHNNRTDNNRLRTAQETTPLLSSNR